ncbi:hypothetical protein RhiirC2_780783 [Rhizophagus irregularis]|uniref:Uncharacterized protein n=1 Tax=Rhizophagus irregularis TaxID=588596 RepID=A0A2N1N6U3_9GLOM|nr:hypothetical protein RhiirC2_780783 [Rhizophagus irregularis]
MPIPPRFHKPFPNDKGKCVAFDIPTRQPSPDGNAAAIKSAPSRYHAAAYLRDAPDAFKAKFTTNRSMCDEVDCSLSRYSSYGARAQCEGSGDNKKILVFFNNHDDYTDCITSPRADLLNLAFSHYSPADAKLTAKEMTVAFRGKGLTWHPPNEAQNLYHVCGRPGCSPSVYNLRTTRKVDDRLIKLYSRFNAGPRRNHQDSRQLRENSNSRSRSRSNSRSRNNNSSSSRSNNNNNNTNTSRPNTSRSSNRTNNNNNNNLRNNENSSGSTQPPHKPHSNLSAQLGSIMEKLDSFSPSKPSPSND